jgi:hypothetical protein
MVAKSYRLLRAILNTAVTEDELIIVTRSVGCQFG